LKKILIPLGVTLAIIILSFLFFGEIEQFSNDLLVRVGHNRPQYALASFVVLVSDIFLPVPSSIVMYLNGLFLGAFGGFSLSMVSVLCSALIGYFIGRGSSAALRSKPDQVSDNILKQYGYLAILITRGIPVLSESVCIVCGYNRYDLKRYMLWNFLGYVPVCAIYAYAGSVSGSQEQFLISFGASVSVSGILWLFGKKLIDRNGIEDAGEGSQR
jgi:uncharacterized membrane protein YdjX (TVP38/TMEM64 family)